MNTFANAAMNQTTRTTNGMKALVSTSNACVDLFYKIGASRGKNILPDFIAAYVENREVALRIALWARDVRGGAGERELFRQILSYLEKTNQEDAVALMYRTPEVGRWDDVLVFQEGVTQTAAFDFINAALVNKNALCAKWMPRKGELAAKLRSFMGATPKQYRKMLVGLTQVVETAMCAKEWDGINFSHVPSLAAARYRKAFFRNTPKYKEYVDSLVKGTDPKVKVNTGAVYPHDVIKSLISVYGTPNLSKTELDFITKQWEALPNLMGNGNILPMVDVSGSMGCSAGNNKNVTCMDIAVSLGLYCADKNQGKFKDLFLTFSTTPELLTLKGDIVQKVNQMVKSSWNMSTDISRAMDKILSVAKNGNVSNEEMPLMLLIFSDMQFNQCARFDDSAMQMFKRKFEAAGYTMPKIVFWNLNSHSNVPVSSTESGVALVSGFSPNIMKALLSNDMEQFTPEAIMLKAVMVDRYNF